MNIQPILAHQYGWDEVLLFVVPIVAVVLVIRHLEKRRPPDDGDNE
jgi:hypothetical protein